MIQKPNYLDVIVKFYPELSVTGHGDASVYANLEVEGAGVLPSEAELDAHAMTMTRDLVWRAIQAERDRRKGAGLAIGANWFHSDDTSRIQYLGLVMMGAGLPPGIMWKTMGGSFIEMTPTLAGQIFQAMASKDIAIFTVAEQHKALMYASATPLSYNYLTGTPVWPLAFGE